MAKDGCIYRVGLERKGTRLARTQYHNSTFMLAEPLARVNWDGIGTWPARSRVHGARAPLQSYAVLCDYPLDTAEKQAYARLVNLIFKNLCKFVHVLVKS